MSDDKTQQRIEELQEQLRNTPVNKGTEKDRARIKAQIAKLQERQQQQAKKGGARGYGYGLRKQGDMTVCLVGYPSTGKSTLLNSLTDAESEVGDYAFTTLSVEPGVLHLNGATIQIWDVPGLIEGASLGKGRGKEVISVVRNADLLIILTDPYRLEAIETLYADLYTAGLRLNTRPPDVKIHKTDKGGINISATVSLEVDEESLKDVCREYGLTNADITIREHISIDEFVDALADNRVYMPCILTVNKIDEINQSYLETLQQQYPSAIFLSAQTGTHIEQLKSTIWSYSGLITAYMKKIGEEPDYDEPLVVKQGVTIEGACSQIHKDFVKRFKYARIWGPSAAFPEQTVGKDHTLQDGDVVELHFYR